MIFLQCELKSRTSSLEKRTNGSMACPAISLCK